MIRKIGRCGVGYPNATHEELFEFEDGTSEKEMDTNEMIHKLMGMRNELKSMIDVIESIITNLVIKEQEKQIGGEEE